MGTESDFNPRSREGSDIWHWINYFYFDNFNPRSREGSDDLAFTMQMPVALFQSTLPRRERLFRLPESKRINKDFNPRSREGSDPKSLTVSQLSAKFQSTLPRRERLTLHHSSSAQAHFNPRSREGSDLFLSRTS